MADLAVFEEQRSRMWGVAYRLTGSVMDADDAVQDAWLRWQSLPNGEATHPRGYLTTVVSRICYDQLGSARARRESYVGPWLPEPVVAEIGPEAYVILDESVGLAMLAVLERLTPAERTAFVLHDVFAVPFPEIADIVGKSPEAARKLASRARKRVRAQTPLRSPDRGEHRRVVEAFLAAATEGDLQALLKVLDPGVVWRSDGGGKVIAARIPVVGPEKVAHFARRLARGFDAATMSVAVRDVNGAPGLVFVDPAGGRMAVLGFTVYRGRLTAIDLIVNSDKLSHLDPGRI
ncbi:RNA polymerase sigma factor SigJ [Streptomyces sp. A5-4]|uniref:RNA polymerase sigma factor SigJ n=1 Tax=Streptomyces sp. A5-4 TaxID=3384771 RepID=UPI003DA8F10A